MKRAILPPSNSTAMTKYFIYDNDNWVGYDGEETYVLKESFANNWSWWQHDLVNRLWRCNRWQRWRKQLRGGT
ncbi:glycoside hydrolase family 18 protein [Glonium stellatum]|uniref:Glycoside hydrolase family 18 protein n=1 Tax=Glonium stellatum TaxID=574774 RepID=A0A8E2JVB8_9PEZI|nr:glycoside hydrolase family 18 protein [Glonium stellatum]